MYKNQEKRRETERLRQRRYREKKRQQQAGDTPLVTNTTESSDVPPPGLPEASPELFVDARSNLRQSKGKSAIGILKGLLPFDKRLQSKGRLPR